MPIFNGVGSERHLKSPAFIYDENRILQSLRVIGNTKAETRCKILFSLKSFSIPDGLQLIALHNDGFSVSSVFEARLARNVLRNEKLVHITTPGFKPDEIKIISELCDCISFNSLPQWERYNGKIGGKTSCGLRVNPQLPFVKDDRYNPCRRHSKLGVPLNQLSKMSNDELQPLKDIKGLHFHTNCESTNFHHLFKTVRHLDAYLPRLLGQVDWVNLGGGYLIEDAQNLEQFIQAVALLRDKYGVEVFFEPGKAIVGSAGYMLSTVVDIFKNDGFTIAVLDTTVNHMPEVFEYQYKPDVMQESPNGKYKYTLVGATCLAGDLFGKYRFDEPLEIGYQIIFKNMGAYTLVKAHMFNGVNLPTIYSFTQDGKFELKKQFNYEDFKSRCGGNKNVSI